MRRRAEAVVTGTLAAVGAALAAATPALTGSVDASRPYYTRPSFFPFAALALVVVFGAWSAWQAWRGVEREASDEIEAENTSVKVALVGAGFFAAYIALTPVIGYPLATFVSLTALGRYAGLALRFSALLSLITTALLYVTFVIGFKVWFSPSWFTSGSFPWN